MSIAKKIEAGRDGLTPLRVYHINGRSNGKERERVTRVWTHPLDEECIACHDGRTLPNHIKLGLSKPTPATLAVDRAHMAAPRRTRRNTKAAQALAALTKEQS